MKYRISIPEPCHEDWHKMTPQEQGRFCDKCQKCVVDFTGLSSQQMFHHIHSGKDLCGRFRADQLDRIITETPVKKSRSFQYLFSSALVFFGANQVFGQSENQRVRNNIGYILQDVSSSEDSPILFKSACDSISITGTVSDESTGERMPFANVYCAELDIGTTSDLNGEFKLVLPARGVNKHTVIRVSYLGYENVDIFIGKASRHQNIKLDFRLCESFTGLIVIENDTPKQRFKNWLKRVF